MGASLKCLPWSAAERYASAARTVVHLIVGPARDERCVVLSLSCGARLRPGYPQHYCTLRMPVARPACVVVGRSCCGQSAFPLSARVANRDTPRGERYA
jgi:hypothetical protein